MEDAGEVDDNRVPYEIESWTLGHDGVLIPTRSQFEPLSFPDRHPLVGPDDAVREIRVSFPPQRRTSRRDRCSSGHRRRSFSPSDSVSLNQHLRRGFAMPASSSRNLVPPTDQHDLKIGSGLRPDAQMAIARQAISRYHLQWLERRRRHRWLLKDAPESLLYSLNLYSESDLQQSPYPNF